MSRAWLHRATILFLAILWSCTVYRAATQSISIDEAFSYDRFISKPFVEMMNGEYEANNHVLYTLLAQLSVEMFGVSELAMRVPTLLGGAMFFTALFLLGRLLFTSTWIFLLVIAVTGLNPFILDYLSIARGYGLASGLYLVSLYLVISRLMGAKSSSWKQLLAGVSLGLCVSANLTFLFPGIALVAVFFCFVIKKKAGTSWLAFLGLFVFPFAAIAILINAVPLSHSTSAHFYFGSDTVKSMIDSFLSICFYRDHSLLQPLGREFSNFSRPLIMGLSAAIIALMAYVLVRPSGKRDLDVPVLVTGSLLAVTLTGLFLAKVFFATPYPYRRTGIYLVLIFVLGMGAILQFFDRSGARLFSRAMGALLAAPVLILFLAQINLRMYGEWPFDENFKVVVDRLVIHHAAHPKNNVHFGLNSIHRFQLYFYRTSMGLTWIAPMDFAPVDGSYDYYLLRPEDRGIIEKRKLAVIFQEPSSYTTLAAPAN